MKLSNVLGPSTLMTTTDLEQMVSINQRKTQFSRYVRVGPNCKAGNNFFSVFMSQKTGRKQI